MESPTRILMMVVVGSAVAGCSLPAQESGFDSDDPSARTRALQRAVEADDRTKIPDIIEMLDSPDPAQRMLAIGALKRMTGQTLGYEYAGTDHEREQSIRRWVAWWRENGS